MLLLHELLDKSAARDPSGAVLRHQDTSLSYGALAELTQRTAAGLQQLGVRRGDRVVVQLPNRPELVELMLACSRIGAICVPLNPALKARQLGHVLTDSGAAVLVTAGAAFAQLGLVPASYPALRTVVVVDSPVGTPQLGESGYVSMATLRSADALRSARGVDRDIAALFYTSGSSGSPKGVVVSQANLVSGAICVASYLGNHATDRILAMLPLSFDYGFSQVSTALHVGASVVLANYFSPAAVIDAVRQHQITGLAAIPSIWSQLAAVRWPTPAELALRYVTSSGGVLSVGVISRLRELLPSTAIYSMYGLTEAFRSTFLPPDELERRPTSIGKAVPNQEVLVLRADGNECAPNETGELVHRGSFVTLGYWRNPAATERRFRAWSPARTVAEACLPEMCVWSGDLVRRDEEGFLYYVGRADQQIKVSGIRVSPTEIEEVVAEVDGVLEAVAVGVSNTISGEGIRVAVLVQSDDCGELETEIRAHCRAQLPAYMIPDELKLLKQLPRTANGKPDRVALAALLASAESSAGAQAVVANS